MLLLSYSTPINQRRYTKLVTHPEWEPRLGKKKKVLQSRFHNKSPSFWGVAFRGHLLETWLLQSIVFLFFSSWDYVVGRSLFWSSTKKLNSWVMKFLCKHGCAPPFLARYFRATSQNRSLEPLAHDWKNTATFGLTVEQAQGQFCLCTS